MKKRNLIIILLLIVCLFLSTQTAYANPQTDAMPILNAKASAIQGLQPAKHAGYNKNPVGGFAVEIKGTVYFGVQTAYPGSTLYSLIDKKTEVIYKAGYSIESLCAIGDTLYFLSRDKYDSAVKIMSYLEGKVTTLLTLESTAMLLTAYDNNLYYMAGGSLYDNRVSPSLYSYSISKKATTRLMPSVAEYVILNGVIYYANNADAASFSIKDPDEGYTSTYKYGKLYGMRIGATKGTQLTTFGVRELCATSDSVVFQNMTKSYTSMLYGDGGDSILTGRLTVMPINGKASKVYPKIKTMFVTAGSSGVIPYDPHKCSFVSSSGKETSLIGFGTINAAAMPEKIYLNVAVDDSYLGYKVLGVDVKSFDKEKLFTYEVK